MRAIPLIGAEYVAGVMAGLEAFGLPVDRYLEPARIPPGLRENAVGVASVTRVRSSGEHAQV